MSDGEWLYLSEAAPKLGTTLDALRQQIRRGTVTATRGNDGRMKVYVPSRPKGITPEPVSSLPEQVSRLPSEQANDAPLVAELRRALSESESRRADDISRADQQRRDDLADRDRLHRESMAMMIERVDAAEIRAERVEEKLDRLLDQLLADRREEPRQRWWRKWL
ncbi:putative Helix-turn-helix domain-containing protein [uncultured Gammaproteobacteria bacterium]